VQTTRGEFPTALNSFQVGLKILESLTETDPGNKQWQDQQQALYERIGDALVAQGNLPEALKSFQAALGTADRLAKADPKNANWQLSLSR
jgi:tetratricopeptide (TPR) repeat protein